MSRLELFIPGPPRGQGRPRFARLKDGGVRTYTPKKTEGYSAQVQTAWLNAGQPKLRDEPYYLFVHIRLARPQGHFRVNGELSAAGRRSKCPTRKPDASNVLKLIEDALGAIGALPDDSRAVMTLTTKDWATVDLPEGVQIYAQGAFGTGEIKDV